MTHKKAEDEWKEVYGELHEVNEEGAYIIVDIEGLKPIAYDLDSKEAEIIKEELKSVEPGTTIGILKTDIPSEEPIVVRTEEFSCQGSGKDE